MKTYGLKGLGPAPFRDVDPKVYSMILFRLDFRVMFKELKIPGPGNFKTS